MSEKILKALMRLFAIIANLDKDDTTRGRDLVREYLKHYLSTETINEFLKLYDEYYNIHHKKSGKKGISANSVKVLRICEEVNSELKREQKILVLLQLLEFITYGKGVTDIELEFVQTVAEVFNISAEEFNNAKEFMFGHYDNVPDKKYLLVIDDKLMAPPEVKHIYRSKLDSEIYVLYLPSSETYVFKYTGKQNLRLNGQPIKPNWGYIFDKGSSIRGSLIAPIYYSDVSGLFLRGSVPYRLVFTAKDIEFRFKNSENGIHKFTFSEETGTLVGIMGGSGAGKSTLLNLFNGKYKPIAGQITINGYDIHKDKDKLKGVIGFVPQDDLLIEELTVFQNLYYNAKLVFDGLSEEELVRIVEKVLKDLDLYEIKDLKVGDPLNKFISGGQRKRLNIGLELLREPPIMFVDEPTSGLSSMDSEMVMDLLKEQTLKGKLVIVNIHQPSSDIYKMFDRILFLDKGGYPIFYGNPLDAITYFKRAVNYVDADVSECPVCGNVNPESVLEIIETKVIDEYGKQTRERKISPKEWYEKYMKEIHPKIEIKESKDAIPKSNFKIPNPFKQFKIYMVRDVLSKITNKQYLLLNFLESPVLAVILGFFTKYIAEDHYIFAKNENIPGYLFMAVVVALFLGMTVSAEEIIKDRKILERERFLNLSRASYINSKVILMAIISAIQTISFVIVGNWILGIHGLTFNYWLILFTTAVLANLVGLNISATLNSVVTIYILIPFILVPELLLSGTVVKFDKLHKWLASEEYVPLVGDLMTSRWAYEALAVTQFKDNPYERHFYEYDRLMSDYVYLYSSLIPNLETKVNIIQRNLKLNEDKEKTLKTFEIVKNEVAKLEEKTHHKFRKFNINNFRDKNFVESIRKYFNKLKKEYSKKRQLVALRKDKKLNSLALELGGTDALLKLKNDNYNEKLADMVMNKTELKRTIDGDGKIIRKVDPIFYYPENKYGRAHFYAPVKRIGNYYIDTLWFNVGVIWLTTLLLYITLQFDLFRKMLEWFGDIKLVKPKN
jgi:ABC-type multidrug transport system ATPase subunit